MLFFYGSKQWKEEFSSFEKLVLPLMMGGAVYYLITVPISVFFGILKLFQNGVTQLNPLLYTDTIFYIVLFYLAIWRLVFSNCSLKENNNFFNITKYLIKATISTISIVNFILLLAFIFSDYLDFLIHILVSYVLLFLLVVLYFFFLEFYGQKSVLKPQEIDAIFIYLKSTSCRLKDITSKNKTNINRALLIIFIFILIAAPIGGTYLLKTSVQLVKEETHMLVIDNLFFNRQNSGISGDLYVWHNYSIEFGLIPWMKFKPNISLENRHGENINSKYNLSGDRLLIKNTSWNTIYVNLYGKKEMHDIPQFYTLNINDSNETYPQWELKFNNPYPYDVEIDHINFDKNQQLKLIKVDKNNLRLNEIIGDINEPHMTIIKVRLPHGDIYPNQSITLFFEKNNTFT